MSALPILMEFSDKGIKVRVDGTDLALSAPIGTLTPNLVSRVKEEKPALLDSLARLRKMAGSDWHDVSNDPAQLKAYAELLMISDMRSEGMAPDHYTAITNCRHCGPVPIWEGCPPKVLGCPWCLNRTADRPIPRTHPIHKRGTKNGT